MPSILPPNATDVEAVFSSDTLMILVPEGTFMMGTTNANIRHLVESEQWAEDWYARDLFQIEQPAHTLTLKAYEIARRPVTNADYHLFVWATGYRPPKSWAGFHCPEELNDHPVTGVARADVRAFCDWLKSETGQTYRLPTEPEWERAARGQDERIYPWGWDFDPWRCNTMESGKRETTIVGEYSPAGDSPIGALDMAGNVWEWTNSLLLPYPYDPAMAEAAPDGQQEYAVRGGAWYYSQRLARCTAREGMLASYLSPALGFRLVRDVL
jgi:formylglycine-generating enzyme required for sulfatase activity